MKKRYSHFIKPLQIIIDILLINSIIYLVSDEEFLNAHFLSFITLFWLISSYLTGFYSVYRFTKNLRISTLLARQFFIFILGYFAYFGAFREGIVVNNQFLILASILATITFFKFTVQYSLKKYRATGNNYRTTVVLGDDTSTKQVIQVFKSKANLGYKFLGFFSENKHNDPLFLGNFLQVFQYAEENHIDEIYCSLTQLTNEQVKKINKFANEKGILLKLIPNASELYSKNQSVQYYDDALMVLSVKRLPFEFVENFYIKRIFDIIFSFFVCLFVLSLLWPILFVLVKLESKGPLLFRQKREGINGSEFTCYKFRSMKLNEQSEKSHVTKNDARVTKMGAFMRKTSVDELPQFLNVLKGDMSVVGPRPHLESLSIEYQRDVENYLKRHIVKPGITGLAQVSGYRGEIKKKADIKNRIRFDIFYIENWSFFLDIKIIFKTILNVFQGEEKAY
ncbi:exopolysaccharide biosynthesis polyprenyl glycosylphosphotransferase [Polaribacter sp.]|nr:exopolysaccharide biosynthesis polyprenyl glycosylphosphotransferase [Polaribacter sp.]MDA9968584.1 exopolysaccharide biosynthesis polyprenyl glycosylphosphotransferase [Polaribacter sp.]